MSVHALSVKSGASKPSPGATLKRHGPPRSMEVRSTSTTLRGMGVSVGRRKNSEDIGSVSFRSRPCQVTVTATSPVVAATLVTSREAPPSASVRVLSVCPSGSTASTSAADAGARRPWVAVTSSLPERSLSTVTASSGWSRSERSQTSETTALGPETCSKDSSMTPSAAMPAGKANSRVSGSPGGRSRAGCSSVPSADSRWLRAPSRSVT